MSGVLGTQLGDEPPDLLETSMQEAPVSFRGKGLLSWLGLWLLNTMLSVDASLMCTSIFASLNQILELASLRLAHLSLQSPTDKENSSLLLQRAYWQ